MSITIRLCDEVFYCAILDIKLETSSIFAGKLKIHLK